MKQLYNTHSLCEARTHSLIYQWIRYKLTHSLAEAHTHSLSHSLSEAGTNSLTQWSIHTLTQWSTYTLTYSAKQVQIHSLSEAFIHSLNEASTHSLSEAHTHSLSQRSRYKIHSLRERYTALTQSTWCTLTHLINEAGTLTHSLTHSVEQSHSHSSPDVILCGWLGSKHQLNNTLTQSLGEHLTHSLTQ